MVTEHAASIEHWLVYARNAAIVAVAVIGIGWFLTRETPHAVLRWVRRTWDWARRNWGRRVRTRFTVHATFALPMNDAWNLVRGQAARLEESWRYRDSTPISTYVQNDEQNADYFQYILDRDGLFTHAFHGIRVFATAEGAAASWIFWVNGHWILKPLMAPGAFWEKLRVRRWLKKLQKP